LDNGGWVNHRRYDDLTVAITTEAK
jgi:hypothetical protein